MVVGMIALLFSWWMIKKWKEPLTWQFMIFIGLSVFIVLYGLFILIFQPQWWIPAVVADEIKPQIQTSKSQQ